MCLYADIIVWVEMCLHAGVIFCVDIVTSANVRVSAPVCRLMYLSAFASLSASMSVSVHPWDIC